MRVLIIKTSSLGDVVHALPVIDYLRQARSGIEIDWVVEEQFLPLLEHNPALSRIHVIRTKAWRKAPFSLQTRNELKRLWTALRERPYDLTFDLQGNLKSGLAGWFSGADKRLGFSKENVQERLNLFFTTRKIPFRPVDRHVTDRYLRLVSVPFGKDYPGLELSGDIVSSAEDEASADAYMATLPDGLVFLFQVGTTWSTKLWRAEGWIELARRLKKGYPGSTVLINWGSPEEKALAEQIVHEVGNSVRLLPWLRIRELVPVIRKADLVIGGDTGPVYLAAAVGTPTVSYYRATNSVTYAPKGEQHRSIQAAMPCAACLKTACDRDEECRRSILVDDLYNAVRDLIS